MPAIRIENKSDDDVIICLDGEEKELADGESALFENKSKGEYKLKIHRKRIPKENIPDSEAPQGLAAIKEKDSKPGSHVQLDASVSFDVNSSKASLTLLQDIKGIETLHEDVIFVGYNAELAGAKLISKKDTFASEKIRKTYLFQQLKGAFLPVGLIGFIVMALGAVFTAINLHGDRITIGSQQVSLARSLLLLAGGVLAFGYFLVNVHEIRKRAKSLSENG